MLGHSFGAVCAFEAAFHTTKIEKLVLYEAPVRVGRARTLAIPTLLMLGSETASPELKRSMDSLSETLPHSALRIFDGQEHNAMDTIPQEFAATLTSFLLEPHR